MIVSIHTHTHTSTPIGYSKYVYCIDLRRQRFPGYIIMLAQQQFQHQNQNFNSSSGNPHARENHFPNPIPGCLVAKLRQLSLGVNDDELSLSIRLSPVPSRSLHCPSCPSFPIKLAARLAVCLAFSRARAVSNSARALNFTNCSRQFGQS